MKIACCQLNPVVGDVDGNLAVAKVAIENLSRHNPDLIVFTELFLTGYPPRDLLFRSDVVSQNLVAKETIIKLTESIKPAVAFGYVERNPEDGGKGLFNAICVAQNGRILQQRYKTLLPTYDVFEERRYFQPGPHQNITPVVINGTPVGIIICEEAWNDKNFWPTHDYDFDPVEVMVQRGAKYLVSINASPFQVADNAPKDELRIQMMRKHCERHGLGCIYVNQVGANDEIICDGNSFALDKKGLVIAHSTGFDSDIMMVDTDAENPELASASYKEPVQQTLLRALIHGVSDYFQKQPVFREAPAFIGLSGGIDSALTAYVAVQALGKDRVIGVSMPREGISSEGSKSDATRLAERLGIRCITVPIGALHDDARSMLDGANYALIGNEQGAKFMGFPFTPCINAGVTDENQQARLRGMVLMSLANYYNGIVLTTGNKSEMAVGYCSIYGDMCGGLAVISDIYKGDPEKPSPTTVYGLCQYINEFTRSELIPWSTIRKPPSAELRVGQTDQQSLPPYGVLDDILTRFVDQQKPVEQIHKELGAKYEPVSYFGKTEQMFGKGRNLDADIDWACNAVLRNEYKRKQGAPGLKVSPKHWKYGWHMPIVHRMKVGK